MAGEKKTIKDTGRNKEIRVRYVKPETFRALAECGAMLKEKTVPDTVLKLIHNYKADQLLIKQLQARNTQLNASLLAMVNEKESIQKVLADFIKYTDRFNEMTVTKAKGLLKKLNSKRGTKRSR